MFAAPPKLSEDEIRQGELEASYTVQQFLTTSVLLYLSPFAVEALWNFL